MVAVLACLHPLHAQRRVLVQQQVTWDDSAQRKESHRSSEESDGSRFRDVHLSGAVELGQALANASSDTGGIVLDASSRTATTLSGSATLDWWRFTLAGVGGMSLSRNNEGGYGRVVAFADLLYDENELPIVQLGADYTGIQSPQVAGLMSAGALLHIGTPHRLQAGVRVGGRWRASHYTPVTAIDLGHTSSWWFGTTLLSGTISSAGYFTKAPFQRTVLNSVTVGRVTKRVSVGDIAVNAQVAHGAWALGARVVRRVGRAPVVWDDPLPNEGMLRQAQDGSSAAVGRLIWAPFNNLSVSFEGGRQLSDPILGLSGVRYASVSVRMNFEAGRRNQTWLERQQMTRAAEIMQRPIQYQTLVVTPLSTSDGRRLIVFRGLEGDAVEIAGDLTNWKPVSLKRCTLSELASRDQLIAAAQDEDSAEGAAEDASTDDDRDDAHSSHEDDVPWCGYFAVQSGVYHLVYRSGQGEWRVPPGLAAVDDSFDGSVGLLIVP